MAGIGPADDREPAAELALHEPRQRRTREQWERVLDAGVRLLEDGGYGAFTIAALCERADVAPRALYARAATKDALFLAVYERGMNRVLAGHEVFRVPERWDIDDDQVRVEQAVRLLVKIFTDNAAFLRAVVLISGVHPEVRRRGEAYASRIGELFSSVLVPLDKNPTRTASAQARQFCFSLIFAAMVVRTAYGPGFGVNGDLEALTQELVTMTQLYLGAEGDGRLNDR